MKYYLDTNILEFWVGFQKEPDVTNRYGIEKEDGYYPCKMVAYYPLGSEHMDQHNVQEYVDDMNKLSC